MKILNETVIRLDSRSQNESYARAAVCAFISSLDPLIEEIADLRTAVSEAVTNCIVHAYPDTIGTITLTVRILAPRTVYIKVRDTGKGIESIEKALTPLYTTSPENERSGLGFSLMQCFTDKMKVHSVPGKGTTVIMSRELKEPKAREEH